MTIAQFTDALKERFGDRFSEHEVMADHTTMHLGGVADFYVEADTTEEIIQAATFATQANVPYFLVGGGANVIFSDFGFPGLIIHNRTKNISLMTEKSQAIVDAGVPGARLVMEAAARNLGGLEFLATIPGTIGGAVYGNAGAYGGAIGDYVRGATLLMPDGTIKQVDQAWFVFSYRMSRVKQLAKEGKPKPIILTVTFQFQRFKREDILGKIGEMHGKRRERQPQGETVSGSIFKNPAGRPSGLTESDEFIKKTANYLIRAAGAHRLRVGGAALSPKNANWIVNLGTARSGDIRDLTERIRTQVREKTGEVLEEEIEYVGQW
ncbi:UDP-N-acetylmuramate dehydrogenase [Candidatus Berkelbacteria bacterium]|nr:UDP-N-acetylmuramate dehydrogenase [Candidatus Berkelbacteria bacterium]